MSDTNTGFLTAARAKLLAIAAAFGLAGGFVITVTSDKCGVEPVAAPATAVDAGPVGEGEGEGEGEGQSLAPLAGEGEGEAVLAPAPMVAPASTPQ
jgi:hypothetical protein